MISGMGEERYLSPPLRKQIDEGFYPPLCSLSHHPVPCQPEPPAPPELSTTSLLHLQNHGSCRTQGLCRTSALTLISNHPAAVDGWTDGIRRGLSQALTPTNSVLSFPLQTLIIQRPPLCVQARPLPSTPALPDVFCLPSPHTSSPCSVSRFAGSVLHCPPREVSPGGRNLSLPDDSDAVLVCWTSE